jgi:hypothetical protein
MKRRKAELGVQHMALAPGRMVGPTFHLVSAFASFFGSTDVSWPKTDCIYDPSDDLVIGAMKKHEIHEIDMKTVRIEREMLSEPSPVAPSPPSK